MGKIIGIDYGTVRMGVAISDGTRSLARILTTLLVEKKLDLTADKLIKLIENESIEEIVIGLPLRMNGKKGAMADEVEQFAEILKGKTHSSIIFWDERLTTVQAERTLREANMSRKKRSAVIDSLTAVVLLQSYLDNRSFRNQTILS